MKFPRAVVAGFLGAAALTSPLIGVAAPDALAAAAARVGMQDENAGAPPAQDRVAELRAELKRLNDRARAIREELRALGGEDPLEGALRPLERFELEGLDGLREHLDRMRHEFRAITPPDIRFHLRAPGAGGGAFRMQGLEKGVAISVGPDGRVSVTVNETDENGNVRRETYEAESLEAFREQHPDVAAEHGIGDQLRLFTAPDGELDLGFGLDLGDRDGLLRRLHPHGLAPAPGAPRSRPAPLAPTRPSAGERLGVGVATLDADRGVALGFAPGQGLLVRTVAEGSLARRLGIREGDVLLAIDGRRIHEVADVADALRGLGPDDEVRVEIEREGVGPTMLRARKTEVPRETRSI